MEDSRARSVAKGLSWRIIATCTTMSLVFLVTGDLETMAHVGMADVVIKLAFYYLHERAWGRIAWGRMIAITARAK